MEMMNRQELFQMYYSRAISELKSQLWQKNPKNRVAVGGWPLGTTRRRVRELARKMARHDMKPALEIA